MFGLGDDLHHKIKLLKDAGDALTLWIIDHEESFSNELKNMNSQEFKVLQQLLEDWGNAKKYNLLDGE